MTFDEVYYSKTVEQCPQGSYHAWIIGDKNNLYKDQGVLVDYKGCLMPYKKNDFNYFYSPGTPVCIEQDPDKDGFAVIKGVLKKNIKVGNKQVDMLWDGFESHPLVHLHNYVNRILLEKVSAEIKNDPQAAEEHNKFMECAVSKLISDNNVGNQIEKYYQDCISDLNSKGGKGKGKGKGKEK